MALRVTDLMNIRLRNSEIGFLLKIFYELRIVVTSSELCAQMYTMLNYGLSSNETATQLKIEYWLVV
jgi:hypothetical protein